MATVAAGTPTRADNRRAAGVTVRPFEAGDGARWDSFVASCPGATFFHRAGWREIIEDVFRHRACYVLAERNDDIVGVLPMAELSSRLFGHALVSLPFCVYGGPAANDEDASNALLAHAGRLARSLRVEYLELRNRAALRADWPRQDLYVTFRKALAPEVDANMLAIPRKQRAMVRKGIKHGLQSRIDANSDTFFDLYADNVHRHGTPPFPRRYFARLLEVFADSCEVLTVTTAAGKPVSGVISFNFRDEVLPYYAGDLAEARDTAANDFKYWEVMRRACERGVRLFDFGRSKRGTGSFDFKKNWGFEPTPLAYEYDLVTRSTIPQNNPMNPRYAAAIAVWRRLPRGLVNAIGPMLARNLG